MSAHGALDKRQILIRHFTPIIICRSIHHRLQRPDPSGTTAARHRLIRNRKPSRLTFKVAGSTVLAAATAVSVITLWPASAATAPPAATTHVKGAVPATATDIVQTSTINIALTPSQYDWFHAVQAYMVRQQFLPGPVRTEVQMSEQLPPPAPKPQPAPTTPAAAPIAAAAPVAAPVPAGTAQQIALAMLGSYGWPASEFSCLQPLWAHESGWNVYASNPNSGAYGIPQALPGSKMASAGPDWQTDAATQIRWGLSYIQATYGSPCAAWAHSQATGWY